MIENIVTHFHGNVWAADIRQQGKGVCAGRQHTTIGRAVLCFFRPGVIYEGLVA
jgi:hypothetical protein